MSAGSTANFEAPEVRATGRASFASDIFSMAMTAVQIMNRTPPGRHEWEAQIGSAIQKVCSPPTSASDSFKALLLKMVEVDEGKRPNAFECSAALSSITTSLGGDPRIDPTSRDYDLIEEIEDKIKGVKKAQAKRFSSKG